MCDNQKCLNQKCKQYDKCWFLKVKCFSCNNKVDVRDCNKTIINLPINNKESKIEVICCPICGKEIW